MKKLFYLTITALLLATVSPAQVDSLKFKLSNHELAERLMLKSKRQRTTGLVLLASGIALEGLAIALYPKDYDWLFGSTPEKDGQASVSTVLFIAGAAAWISSIPVLISGRVNRRKAKLLLRTETVQLSPQFKTNERQIQTGITINF